MRQTRTIRQEREMPKNLALCGLFAALIGTGAFIKITIPVQPFSMHFTLQWFFVLLAGFLLEPKAAFASVCVYLTTGLVGLPVFASGGGPAYLLRPTFGFLIGFALAAYVIGTVCQAMPVMKTRQLLLSSVCGLFVYYAAGILYFYIISNYVIAIPVAWSVVFVNCGLLTIGGDFILCVLASMTAARMQPAIKRAAALRS